MSYTGPYYDDQYINWPGQVTKQFRDEHYRYRTDSGSRRAPLPYERRTSQYGNRSIWPDSGYAHSWAGCDQYGSSAQPEGWMYNDHLGLTTVSQNRARARFIDKLRQEQSSSIGETLGEWHQSFSMIASRLAQLYGIAKMFRRGDLNGVARALQIRPPNSKDLKDWSKSAPNLWLEWHFGWSPLLSDIHNAMEALSKPLPQIQRTVASSRASRFQPMAVTSLSGYYKLELEATFSSITRMEGYARLVSPSVGLLDQLGLLNPAEVAWNLVPFSFLVDHVIGIGDFIGSYTDTLGWELTMSSMAHLRTYTGGTYKESKDFNGGYDWKYGEIYSDCLGAYMVRTISIAGLPPYLLSFTNPFRDISVARGATYVALLLQVLNSL